MELPEIPEHLVEEPSGLSILFDQIERQSATGCSNNGGYVKQPAAMHDLFANSGTYHNDYSDIGNGEYDAYVIVDSDLDGLSSAAMYRYEYGDDVRVLYGGHREEDTLTEVLSQFERRDPDGDAPIFVADISPDTEEAWSSVDSAVTARVRIRDHHPKTVDIDVNEYVVDSDMCSAEVVLDCDIDSPASHITQLAVATRVRDLWIPESDDFDLYSLLDIFAEVGHRDRVVDLLAERGTAVLADPELFDRLKQLNFERWHRTHYLLEREDLHEVRSLGEQSLRVISGHPADTSHLAYCAKQTFGDDLVGILLPEWDDGSRTVSLRSTDEFPVAGAVARRLGGGGHDVAASGRVWVCGETDAEQLLEAAAVVSHTAAGLDE